MQYSIVNLKDVLADNDLFRIDAQFFRKDLLLLEEKIKLKNWDYLGNLSKSIINFGAYSLCNQIEFISDGACYLTVGDIGEGLINFEKSPKIKEALSVDILWKSLVKEGQVLLTIAGTIGNAAVAQNLPYATNSNQAIANISLKENISPYYITIFLNCRYGKSQTQRLTISSVQPNLLLTQVKQIKTYVAWYEFQSVIEVVYKKALEQNDILKEKYKSAQTLLLSELGLLNWKPKHHLSFVKNYSDTQKAGRFDAEYYQPKYDEIVAAIKSNAGGWATLGNLVSLKKCIEVGSDEYSDEGIPFVRVSNLSQFEITEEKYISEKLYSELTPKEESDVTFETSKNHQPKKGEILFSKDATPGIAYFLSEEPQKMIPSGGILRLKLKDKRINPSYLTLVLNSIIVQEQINRDVGGSVILHWRPDQVEQTLIPILREDKQEQIQERIIESFNLRKRSKHLLECAKKAVEMAIENDEKTAMQWLDSQMDTDC